MDRPLLIEFFDNFPPWRKDRNQACAPERCKSILRLPRLARSDDGHKHSPQREGRGKIPFPETRRVSYCPRPNCGGSGSLLDSALGPKFPSRDHHSGLLLGGGFDPLPFYLSDAAHVSPDHNRRMVYRFLFPPK